MNAVTPNTLQVLHDTRVALGCALLMLAIAILIISYLANRWVDEFEQRRGNRKAASAAAARPSMNTDRVFMSAPIGRATVQAPWIVVDAPRDQHGREIVQ